MNQISDTKIEMTFSLYPTVDYILKNMDHKPQISIIVPVYNTEKYLRRCIDSILAQTFTDFELLLIDDGSTDSSGTICDEYAQRDSRIQVFHKPNGGVSSARQLGINKANGYYSIHADSDDWIEPNMLQEMHEQISATTTDILITDYFINDTTKELYINQNYNNSSPKEILNAILTHKLLGSLWNKLIRHDLYIKYNIRFVKGIDYCEDALILVQLLLKNIKPTFLNKAYYHYDMSNYNSITRHYTSETYKSRKKFILYLSNILPGSYHSILTQLALEIKGEAMANGVLPEIDIKSFMPCRSHQIIYSISKGRVCRRFKTIILITQLLGYNMGSILARKLSNNNTHKK